MTRLPECPADGLLPDGSRCPHAAPLLLDGRDDDASVDEMTVCADDDGVKPCEREAEE